MPKGYCPSCGSSIEGEFTYCPNCGKPLPSFEEIREKAAPISPEHRMELIDNIQASLRYACLLFKDLGTLIVLAILNLIPFVNFIVTGYVYRVIRESPESEILPPLQGFFRLWIDGLKLVVITFVYLFIPILAISLSGAHFALSVIRLLTTRRGGMIAIIAGEFLLFLVVVLLSVFFVSVILLMSVVHSVKTGSVWKAFSIVEVLGIIGRVGWGKYLAWQFVVLVLGFVFGMLGGIPFVGWLLLLGLSPAFSVFIARSAVQIYYEGKPAET